MHFKEISKGRFALSIKSLIYAGFYFCGKFRARLYNGELYADALSHSLMQYLSDKERGNKPYLFKTVACAIKSFILFGFKPHEFFMYGLNNKSVQEWSEYLAEKEKIATLTAAFGMERKMQLRNKWTFYELAKPFFKREVFHLTAETEPAEFYNFAIKTQNIFCKPADGAMGVGIRKIPVDDSNKTEVLDELLSECRDWVVEECIEQAEELACWNRSSINTIRFPSFYRNGVFTPFYPRIRVGRAGQIVDNAAQGGLLAFIDDKTGVIYTDGYLKKAEIYENHPDSHLRFKGTQIPHWDELLQLAENLHKALPQHVYIAWDFAYSVKGWDIVEANWGQMESTQMILGHGIRKEFHELLGA